MCSRVDSVSPRVNRAFRSGRGAIRPSSYDRTRPAWRGRLAVRWTALRWVTEGRGWRSALPAPDNGCPPRQSPPAIHVSFVHVAPASPEVPAGPRRPAHRACSPLDLPQPSGHRRELLITSVCELGELLAVNDGVGPSLIWRAMLDGDVVGKVERPRSERD